MRKQTITRKVCSEPMAMALSLNKKRMTERVIIGKRETVELWLADIEAGEMLYEAERPLGSFLFEHESQAAGEWNENAGSVLMLAVGSTVNRKENADAAWNYLEEKLNSQNPVCIFTACQLWHWYDACHTILGSEKQGKLYGDYVISLTKSFKQKFWGADGDATVLQAWGKIQRALERTGRTADRRVDVRYSARKSEEEWVVISESFYPALQYYLKQLMNWKMCFCRCSNCGKVFVATSGHYSLCSSACHTEKNRQNKREFDARAKEKGYDIDYKNVCQRMRNRLNKMNGLPKYPDGKRTEARNWFDAFRTEAIRRKKKIGGEADYRPYRDWLFEMEREFERICAV